MIRQLSTVAMVLAGLYILFPVAAIYGLFWFADVVRAHTEAEALRAAEQAARVPRSFGPEIPQCDRQLWDRVRTGCPAQEIASVGP